MLQNGLKLSVFGDITVVRDGEIVALPRSKKTRALLAYLCVVGRAQRRERLCEMFWPIPDDPLGALRWSLWKIRQVVGPKYADCVRADRNTIFLDPDGLDCDFHSISSTTLQDLDNLPVDRLEALVDLTQREFLEGLGLRRCPEFEAWRVAQADRVSVFRLRHIVHRAENNSSVQTGIRMVLCCQ